MSHVMARQYPRPLHPVHAFFLAGAFTPFLGAALSDYAYTRSFQVQWLNFSSWLLAGALVFAGVALLCAIADLARAQRRGGLPAFYLVLLLAIWALGLIDAFVHAGDAWATMSMGLLLSVIVALLAAIAAAWSFSQLRVESAP